MSALRLSYAELGARLGRSADAVRDLARRKGWQRVTGNDGRVVVLVDESELPADRPPERPGERPPEQPDMDRLRDALEAEMRLSAGLRERVARLEGEAVGHGARVADLHNALADLAGRLDKATAELTEARRPLLEWLIAALRR